jgi:hypothetical protein
MSVEDCKKFLGLTNEYQVFSALERRVLIPACKEINESKTIEICVDFSKTRAGKKIGFIKFKVRDKFADTEEDAGKKPLARLMSLLPDLNRTERNQAMLELYLAQHGEEYCIAAVQYVYCTCKSIDVSFSAYLNKALANNYAHEVGRRRKIERELRTLRGDNPTISDFDPSADQVYNSFFDQATEDKKAEILYELRIRTENGKIKEKVPRTMKIRQAMQYVGIWL